MSLADQLSSVIESDEKQLVPEVLERRPLLTRARFKAPISTRQLVGSERVVFEFDASESDMMLGDDDEEDVEDNEHDQALTPVGYSDPKRYAANRKKKAEIENYLFDPALSFDTFYDTKEIDKMENIQVDGAVKKMVVREGAQGSQVPDNCKLFVHYVISGDGISEPFDSTVLQGYPACIDFRNTEIIAGLFIAIKSMKVGEIAKVWIRHDFAYGLIGCPPRIPPSLDVHCLVEILSLIEESQLKLIPFMTTAERMSLDFKEIENAALELRLIANGEYNAGSFWLAVKRYRKAINILEDYPTRTRKESDTRQGLLYTLYMNLGACYLKLSRYQQVCVCCKMGIRCAESGAEGFKADAKLYYRFAEAKLQLSDATKAKSLNKEAKLRAPNDQNILEQEARINTQLKRDNEISKLFYGKMGSAFDNNGKKDLIYSSSKDISAKKTD